MISLERTIEIARDPDDVFDLVADPGRYRDFFVGITRWQPCSEVKTGEGARYRVLMKVGAIEAGGIVRVTRWVKPETIEWDWERGLHQRGRWQIDEIAAGARLTLQVEFDLSGGPVGAVVERLAGRVVGRNMWASLMGARRVLEVEDAVPVAAAD